MASESVNISDFVNALGLVVNSLNTIEVKGYSNVVSMKTSIETIIAVREQLLRIQNEQAKEGE